MLEERTITHTFNYQYRKEKIHECSLCRISWHQHCEQHLSTLTRDLTQDFQYYFSPREDLMKVDNSWPKMQQNVNKLHVHSVMSDLMDYSPPGSSVHCIFQVRILEWVAISYFRGSSQPRDRTHISYVPCIGTSTSQCVTGTPGSQYEGHWDYKQM